ncbi:MAG: ABC transporter substrate-binding protein [Deltaproteobacteria bacterium]|nr:ABC transporter substrate-binding protein [Deltaproteobacteria bacterium]
MTRIVSLVPSWTETLFAIGAGDRVVGCTRFCDEPRSGVAALPKVGGTKDVDVGAVIALRPDLVVANREENTRRAVEALRARGADVLLTDAQSVRDAIAELRLIGAAAAAAATAEACARRVERAVAVAESGAARRPRAAAAVFVWREPWMVAGPTTYADDLLRRCGADNVFGGLGPGSAAGAERAAGRYPRITVEEVVRRAPRLVLLPDEPYAFADTDAAELRAALPSARVVLCSGKDLFWYGTRMAEAIPRIAELLAPR